MQLSSNQNHLITDFTENKVAWQTVNDGVMGGKSHSEIRSENGIAFFSGQVSLENNGGFASVRGMVNESLPKNLNFIVIRVKGDGQKYDLRVRKNNEFDGMSYKSNFRSQKGVWEEISIPLSEFVGTFRGQVYPEKKGVISEEINQVTFLIGDKQVGPFKIEIDWIRAKLENAENSGFTNDSKEQILAQSKSKLNDQV